MQSLLPVFGQSPLVSSSSWGQCLKRFHCSLLGAPLPSPECDEVTGHEPPARLCPQTAMGRSTGAPGLAEEGPRAVSAVWAPPIAALPGSTRTEQHCRAPAGRARPLPTLSGTPGPGGFCSGRAGCGSESGDSNGKQGNRVLG